MTAAHDSSGPAIPAVPGAGGVVFDSVGRVLLVRYQGSGAWAFPKGHVEEGETLEQTAVREVQEETGIRASVAALLHTTEYTNDRGEARQIHWFRMQLEAADPALESTLLENTFAEGGFKDAGEALNLLSYPEDQQLLRAALAQLGG
jgi:diadenosine hexaphosphate hydrolase (ATP-forming)